MKRVKDFTIGQVAIDRGKSFVIRRIQVNKKTGTITFINDNGIRHGPYHRREYLGAQEVDK